MSLSKEIQDAIQKNMPNMVAGELQAFIKKAEETSAELKGANVQLAKNLREMGEMNSKILELKDLKHTAEVNKLLAEDLTRRENALKLTILESELASARLRSQDIYNLVDRVFRNVTVRENVFDSVPIPMTNGYNGTTNTSIQHFQTSKNSTKDVE